MELKIQIFIWSDYEKTWGTIENLFFNKESRAQPCLNAVLLFIDFTKLVKIEFSKKLVLLIGIK